MRECISTSLTLNNCIDCRLLQHYPEPSLPVFLAACERLAPPWPCPTPRMMVGAGHPPWSPPSDAGRNLVASNDLDHSYLETLNIPEDWILVTSINVSAGIIGLWGIQGGNLEDITKCQMFVNVFLMHDCQHPCAGDSWGWAALQGPGKAESDPPRPRAWPRPGLTLSPQRPNYATYKHAETWVPGLKCWHIGP